MKQYFTCHNRLWFAALLILQTLQTAVTVGISLLLNYLIDEIASAITSGEMVGLFNCAKVCCCAAIVIGLVIFLTEKVKSVNIRRIMIHIRQDMISGIFYKSIAEFQQVKTSQYITMLNQNMSTFEENFLKNTMEIYEAVIKIVFSTAALIYINPAVALISIAAMSIPGLITKLFGKQLKIGQEKIMRDTSAYNAAVADSLNGFEVIQTFGVAEVMKNKHFQAASDMERSKSQLSGTMALLYGVSNMASVGAQFFIMVLAGAFAVRGIITLGSIVAVTQLSGEVIGPAFGLSARLGQLKSVKPICRQMKEIIEAGKSTASGSVPPQEMKDTLTMQNVTFSYTEKPAVENVSIQFKAGKKYAVVGKSGSGKSTLLKLLAGYYSEYSGNICVDGLANIPCDVSLIGQDIFLFDDTIRSNITLFGEYGQDAIDKVIYMAGLKEVIAEAENGLDTKVEENGERFSGGERQRIAIARALLHHKNVLLLDEATSALDHENALKIENRILNLKDITCVAVTHGMEPQILRQYDQILVMDKGRIVEQGKYEELMEYDRIFCQLVNAGGE